LRLYLDSSALVKLVLPEPESPALRGYLRQHSTDQRVSSELVRVEVVRAVLAGGPSAIVQSRRWFARLYLIAIDRALLDRAATLAPGSLIRSLDAIHLATAQLMGADLRAVVTYDRRMLTIAGTLGLPAAAPT
jgi:predicted nucleic acid-binding protein